jgi:hypothetical protein
MIVNGYAVLDGFVTLLRFALSLAVLGLGVSAWRMWTRLSGPEERTALEDRSYLLIQLAVVLLGLNLAAWPLFYLLLQSYVSEWPGVMCIYGVTQIGTGTQGISHFLPGLVTALQVTKPALVFVSGAWFVIYLADRRTVTAPLRGRMLFVLLCLGGLGVLDAAAEAAYLGIPKKEEFLSAGCCADVFDSGARASRFVPPGLVAENYRPWLSAAYAMVNLGMVGALLAARRLLRPDRTLAWLAPLLLGTLLTMLVNALFLVDVAAPVLLHLPSHHCPYDLLPQAPQSMLGIALFIVGSFAVGWACVAGWLANCPQTRPYLRAQLVRLLGLGLLGYLGSLVVLSLELAVA